MPSLTAPSSAVVSFPTTQRWTTGEFERYREGWLRGVLSDPELGNRTKIVNTILFLHINRETGAAFPSYETIAREAAISRPNAIKEVKATVDRGHLVQQPRVRQRGGRNQFDRTGEFFYFPAVNGQAMVSMRHHRTQSVTQSMVSKMAVDGITANGVALQAQGFTAGLPEDSLKESKKAFRGRKEDRRERIVISREDPRWMTHVEPYAKQIIGFMPSRSVHDLSFSHDEWHLIEVLHDKALHEVNGAGR